MGLYDLLTSPTGNPYYAQNSAFVNPNSVSTAETFGQRDIPWPSDSNQPYIKIPLAPLIPENGTSSFDLRNGIRYNSKTWGPDFLTRGNQYGLVRTADDIERLTKYFFDFVKPNGNPSGLLFTLKQNLLSLAGDETPYTPFSTITQAAISLSGTSVKKQGLYAGIGNGAFSNFRGTNNPLEISEDFRKGVINRLTTKNPDYILSAGNIDNNYSEPEYTPFALEKAIYLSASPSYEKFNIEKRTNFRSGGTKGNILNYQKGKQNIPEGSFGPTDIINAIPIYRSEQVSTSDIVKDLIDFRIAIIDNTSIGQGNLKNLYLHFRAYIKKFGDAYKADWKPIEYMGRAEKFYRYGGFTRDIDLAFTIAASSKEELMPMYKKLNFLASTLAPSYSSNGYMRGNIAKLTVGDYLIEQPGVITSLNVSIPDDSPWEINLGLDGEPMEDMRQLPHRLDIQLRFIPIHEFRPETTSLNNLPDINTTTINNIVENNQNIVYGKQRFVSLKNQENGWKGSYDKN